MECLCSEKAQNIPLRFSTCVRFYLAFSVKTDCNPSLLGREIKIEVKYLVVITIIWAPETDLEDSQKLYSLNIWNASVKVYCLVALTYFSINFIIIPEYLCTLH